MQLKVNKASKHLNSKIKNQSFLVSKMVKDIIMNEVYSQGAKCSIPMLVLFDETTLISLSLS